MIPPMLQHSTDILPCKYVQSFCQIGVVHHNGHFVYVIAVHSKSACSPNFEGFPWGMQVFLVVLWNLIVITLLGLQSSVWFLDQQSVWS